MEGPLKDDAAPWSIWVSQLGVYVSSCDKTTDPKGPYTAHLRTPTPKTIPGIVFRTTILKWAVSGAFGRD